MVFLVRKSLLTFFAILSFVFIAYSANWELVWSDEFEGIGLPDSTKWSFDTDGNAWDWGNEELQNYTFPDNGNAWIEDGNLVIEARKEKWTYPGDGQEREYTSARLRTLNKGDWTYGKFEISAKLPGGTGSWPAIWMLPSDDEYGGWPKSGEIDIMENIGSEPDNIYVNTWTEYTESFWGDGDSIKVSQPYNSFHIYSLEWTVDTIKFFVDGELVHKYGDNGKGEKHWPFNKRFHLLLNVAVGGVWETQVEESTFPARMYVDYVRVYKETGANNIIKTGFNNNTDIKILSTKNKFSITLPSSTFNQQNELQLKLFNSRGRLVDIDKKNIKIQKVTINTDNLSDGVYYLVVKNGEKDAMFSYLKY